MEGRGFGFSCGFVRTLRPLLVRDVDDKAGSLYDEVHTLYSFPGTVIAFTLFLLIAVLMGC